MPPARRGDMRLARFWMLAAIVLALPSRLTGSAPTAGKRARPAAGTSAPAVRTIANHCFARGAAGGRRATRGHFAAPARCRARSRSRQCRALPVAARRERVPQRKASASGANQFAGQSSGRSEAESRWPCWPVRVVDGASGRLVRVGTFAHAFDQAKKGWWAIVRLNPSLKRLQALVVPVSRCATGALITGCRWGPPRKRIARCCASGCG